MELAKEFIFLIIGLALSGISANWVHDDAKKYQEAGVKVKPTYWAAFVFLFLIIGLPAYLTFKFVVYNTKLKFLNKQIKLTKKDVAYLIFFAILLIPAYILIIRSLVLKSEPAVFSDYQNWKNECLNKKGFVYVLKDRNDYMDCIVNGENILRLEGTEEVDKFKKGDFGAVLFLNSNEYRYAKQTPAPENGIANWQIFKDQNFQLLIPPQWHKNPNNPNQLVLADNSPYYLNFSVVGLNQFEGNATTKSLYANGNFLEAEQAIVKSLCDGTGACDEIIESKSIPVDGGAGIEFIIQYKGLRIDEPRGFLNEIHRTILKNNILYRFWTSQQIPPNDLINEYPKLDPSPIELFRKILDSFKT